MTKKVLLTLVLFFFMPIIFAQDWYVVLGSFKNEGNAIERVRILKNEGIETFVGKVNQKNTTLYRVFYDENFSKSSLAVKKQKSLEKNKIIGKFETSIWCVRYSGEHRKYVFVGGGESKTIVKEVVKEVPVEVVKEIIKEVPVEVVKEVIKEVPVEKIVEKEVIKEVVKEVPAKTETEKEPELDVVPVINADEESLEEDSDVIDETSDVAESDSDSSKTEDSPDAEIPVIDTPVIDESESVTDEEAKDENQSEENQKDEEEFPQIPEDVPFDEDVKILEDEKSETEEIDDLPRETEIEVENDVETLEDNNDTEEAEIEENTSSETETIDSVSDTEESSNADTDDGRMIFVCDSDTGNAVDGALIVIDERWTYSSDSDGKLVIPYEIPDGEHTLTVSKGEEYIVTSSNIFIDDGVITSSRQISIPKKVDYERVKIVLVWGENPKDLDLNVKAGWRHVSYKNKKSKNIRLDIDDTNMYGPETITIEKPDPKVIYECYVEDYSDSSSGKNSELQLSDAKVSVYFNNDFIKTFSVPMQLGKRWNVFNIKNGTQIVEINKIVK